MRSTFRLRSRSNQLDSRVSGRMPPGSDPYIWNILPLGIRLRCVDEHADLPRRAHDVLADALLLCEGGGDVQSASTTGVRRRDWIARCAASMESNSIRKMRRIASWTVSTWTTLRTLPNSLAISSTCFLMSSMSTPSSSDPSFFHGRPASQHTTTCADVCLLRCEAGLFVSFDTAFGSGAAEVPCEPNTEHSIRRSVPSPTAVFCIRSQAT